jgi:hypothetical protein
MIDNDYYYDELKSIDCYTDASYSKEINGSFIGYKIGDMPVRTQFLKNIKNTQAEIQAVEICIDIASKIYPSIELHIHTDCQKVVDSNDIYPKHITMHKMVGHMKRADRNDKQQIFSHVDITVRKALRRQLKIVRYQHTINN